MKVQNIIRMQLVAVGFAAALFFASATPAQEISNTEWPDGQDVVTPGHPAPEMASAAQDTKATDRAATANAATVNQGAAMAQQTPSEGSWTTISLIIFFALATLYAFSGAKRANRNRYARAEQALRSVPLS
jgi:hypothetical protein